MAKKLNIVDTPTKRVRALDRPARRLELGAVGAALGAESAGERIGAGGDLLTLAEIGAELLRRLRSSSGQRPQISCQGKNDMDRRAEELFAAMSR